MEFSKKDTLLSLIFPIITALYGIILFFSREYNLTLQHIMGGITMAAGVTAGVLVIALKINTTECLKAQTITFIVTCWLHFVTRLNIVTMGMESVFDAIYIIYYLAVDLGSIVLMMFKLPDDATAGKRVIVFFSNPILFSLINTLMSVFAVYFEELGLLK